MKKAILICAAMLAACVGFAADPPDMTVVPVTVVWTGATASATYTYTSQRVSKYIDLISLDFAGTANPTCTVSVVTSASQGTGPSRTVLSKTGVAGDTVFVPRNTAQTTAGAAITDSHVEIPVNGTLSVSMYAANVTGITCTAYIFLK